MRSSELKPTKAIARKVLQVVDAGLTYGKGSPEPGKMFVEAAVCFAFGLPHSDNPPCVGNAVRSFKIRLNDSRWPSDAARAKGMRKLAIAQLGSDQIDQRKFADLVIVGTINKVLPLAIERVISVSTKLSDENKAKIKEAIKACEGVKTREQGYEVAKAAKELMYSVRAYAAADYRLKVLTLSAQIGLDALIELKSPGTKWLDLCD